MKAQMFMPVSVVTLLPTLVRWTLHDTESPVRPSDVIVYGLRACAATCGVSLYHLNLCLLKQRKIKILQKGT